MSKFEPKEYLDFSSKIIQQDKSQSALRTAINRFYYACFLIGIEALEKKGWYNRSFSGEDHRRVWEILRRHRNPSGAGDELQKLYRLREHADYHTDSAIANNSQCIYCREDILVTEEMRGKAEDLANRLFPRLKSLASVSSS